MKIKIIASLLMLAGAFSLHGEDVVLKFNKWFKAPIRDSLTNVPDSLVFSSDVEEIVFPDLNSFTQLGDSVFPKLRRVVFGNVEYLPGGSFMNMPELEEIVFKNCSTVAAVATLSTSTWTNAPRF